MCLGVLWLVDAALQAQPDLFTARWWHDNLAQSVMAEPAAIRRSILSAIGVIAPHAAAFNAIFVAIQALIGLCLVLGRFERTALVSSFSWALGVWWVGEGFGTLPTGFAILAAGSPGPVLYYPLIGFLAWPNSGGPRPISRPAGAACWVVLWAGQALEHLPWKFAPGLVLAANVGESANGQPAWLMAMASHAEALARTHPVALPVALAVAEVIIGLGVLFGRRRRWVLGAGIALSILFWVTVQEFGTVLGGNATDLGAAPLMILLAVSLWPEPARDPPPISKVQRAASAA